MKTPMQELIDRIKQLKYSETNEQAWDAYNTLTEFSISEILCVLAKITANGSINLKN